ncbi:hypothetical protein HZC33_00515 [Candidatus Wolfebacteria bacterium]|nr:hypothetical protein [Candidatus Wolfebacteria bacterium]
MIPKNKIIKVVDVVSRPDVLKQKEEDEKSEEIREIKDIKKPFKISLNLFGKKKQEKKEIIIEESKKSKQEIISDFFKPRKSKGDEFIEKKLEEEPKIEFKKEKVKIIHPVEEIEEETELGASKEDGDFLKEEIGVESESIWLRFKKYFAIFLFLALAGAGVYAAAIILPMADIKIITKKSAWNFDGAIVAFKNAADINWQEKQIPGSFFSETKNTSLAFEATGKKNVERKAGGEIIVYNAFSSESQSLVKGTRFEAPDGKIYRLDSGLIIPGAKISDGKIIPSSVKAKVSADKAGQDYNIAPVEKFTIPGFKNSPKYNGFYAKSESPMVGGFVGELPYPTDADIKSAREKTEITLKETLNALMASQIPNDFKVIDSAKQFLITKENINKDVDENGKFSVFLEGEMAIAAFREEDVLKLMAVLAKQSLGENFEAKSFDFNYGIGQVDLGVGKFSFGVNYNGTFWQPINIDNFKNTILGKKEIELKTSVFLIPGVEKATVSFWPFWVKSVPNSVKRINVAVE